MKAINHFVIVDKIKEEPTKVGGLELTEKQNKDVRYVKGRVISFGDQIDLFQGGEIVRYDKHAGHGIEWNDSLYYVLKISDIVLIE
ncbi:co-chaperone GroES [Flavobacteriaceae bacterium]|jgi:co-chaperonin GroES (HSP10)|nr:co-chaperone GroES [Flavobacteriaceae bacterium]